MAIRHHQFAILEIVLVIMIVSEETGAISYAYKGQLTRGVTLENLRAFLSSILVTSERPRNLADWLRALKTPNAKPATPTPAPAKNPPPPAVIRTVLLPLFSLGKISAADSAAPVLLNPMIAAHCKCSSGRFRKSR